jgi:glycosyltransferase involved in cell wall biosynthesis
VLGKEAVAKNQGRAKVLFVIPTLGERLDLLRQTLQSIVAQGEDTVDIIVVCPPTSDAVAIAQEFGAKTANDPGTLSGALNVGFALAKKHHEFGAWMGDDDLVAPGSLNITISALEKRPKAVVAYGYCDYIDDKGRLIFQSKAGRLAPWIMGWGPNLIPLPGMLYRLSALKKAGDFDASLKYSMDLDMLLRLRRFGPFVNTRQTLGAFRWHASSTTVSSRAASLKESELTKRRYLPTILREISLLWEIPVSITTHMAVWRVNKLAGKIQKN